MYRMQCDPFVVEERQPHRHVMLSTQSKPSRMPARHLDESTPLASAARNGIAQLSTFFSHWYNRKRPNCAHARSNAARSFG